MRARARGNSLGHVPSLLGEPLGSRHVVCLEAVWVEGHPALAADVHGLGVLLAHDVAHLAVPAYSLALLVPVSGFNPVVKAVKPVNS